MLVPFATFPFCRYAHVTCTHAVYIFAHHTARTAFLCATQVRFVTHHVYAFVTATAYRTPPYTYRFCHRLPTPHTTCYGLRTVTRRLDSALRHPACLCRVRTVYHTFTLHTYLTAVPVLYPTVGLHAFHCIWLPRLHCYTALDYVGWFWLPHGSPFLLHVLRSWDYATYRITAFAV